MAPNRKNVSTLVESLSNGDLVGLQESSSSIIQPKFLLLTDAMLNKQHNQ